MRPVAGKVQAGDFRGLRGTPAVYAGFGRKGSGGFLDDRGFEQFCITGFGKSMLQFGEAKVDDFFAGFLQQIVRGADDELKVLRGVASGRNGGGILWFVLRRRAGKDRA